MILAPRISVGALILTLGGAIGFASAQDDTVEPTEQLCMQVVQCDDNVFQAPRELNWTEVEDVCVVMLQAMGAHSVQNEFFNLTATDPKCEFFQSVYPLCVDCSSYIEDEYFCALDHCNAPAEVDPDVDITETCAEMERRGFPEFPYSTEWCHRVVQSAYSCPELCYHPSELYDDDNYLGAETDAQKRAFSWLPRVSALLSLMGVCFILKDVHAKWAIGKNGGTGITTYHELMVGIAIFDGITAVAWMFSSYPVPTSEAFILGAGGTWAACRTQAFFIQWGMTSMFYNVMLTFYYALTIVRNWRESDFQSIRRWLHITPLVIGLALAFGGIKYYGWFELGCHLTPAPFGPLVPTLVLVVIPLGFSIALITVIMVSIYLSIRKTASASRKWALGVGSSNNLQTQVFWQSLLYTCSFYISWPVLFCIYVKSIDVEVDNFYFTAMISMLLPLQGFTNFLVYARTRFRFCGTKSNPPNTTNSRFHSSNATDGSLQVGSEAPSFNTSFANNYASTVPQSTLGASIQEEIEEENDDDEAASPLPTTKQSADPSAQILSPRYIS